MATPESSPTQEKTYQHLLQEWFEKYSLSLPQDFHHWVKSRLLEFILRRPNPAWLYPHKVVEFFLNTPRPKEEQLTAAVIHPNKQVVVNTYKLHPLADNQMAIILMRFGETDPELINDLSSHQKVKHQAKDAVWQERWAYVNKIVETVKSDPAFTNPWHSETPNLAE
ncbi:hypothetical protein HYU92_04990 [Candidatus Curtissbacteria bacterium]|nr:hypothetical protein [Candidatus Curtissbacteria bacterium]